MFDDHTLESLPPIPQPEPEVEQAQQQQQQPAQESANDKNIRALREKAQRAAQLERERDDALRKLQEIQAQQYQSDPQDEITLAPDALVEGKDIQKFQKKIKQLESSLSQYQQKTAESLIESQILARYPDYYKVVSPENIAQLRELDPETAETINSSTNLYSKAIAAYKQIKDKGIYQEDLYVAEKERAQKNALKPKPTASIGSEAGHTSPLSRANAFEELDQTKKTALYKEMLAAIKNR